MTFSPVERQTYTLTVGETLELTDAIRARASTLEMVGRMRASGGTATPGDPAACALGAQIVTIWRPGANMGRAEDALADLQTTSEHVEQRRRDRDKERNQQGLKFLT